jgi:hypothetical protein
VDEEQNEIERRIDIGDAAATARLSERSRCLAIVKREWDSFPPGLGLEQVDAALVEKILAAVFANIERGA